MANLGRIGRELHWRLYARFAPPQQPHGENKMDQDLMGIGLEVLISGFRIPTTTNKQTNKGWPGKCAALPNRDRCELELAWQPGKLSFALAFQGARFIGGRP